MCPAALLALRPSGQSWHRRSSNYTHSLFGSLFFFFFNYLPFLERRRKKNSHVWQSQLCVRAYCQPYLTVECVVVPTITTILVCKSRVMVLGLVLWHQIHQLTRQGRDGSLIPPWSFRRDSLRVQFPLQSKVNFVVMIGTKKWQEVYEDLTLILIKINQAESKT